MKSHRNAMIVVLVAAGLMFTGSLSTPTVVAQGLQPKLFLRVYDANGKMVGIVQGLDNVNRVVIAFEVGGFTFPLLLTSQYFQGTSAAYFTTTNCSGTIYLKPVVDVMLPTAVLNPGNTLYIADPSRQDENITTHSVIYEGDPQRKCALFTDTFPRHQAVPLIDLNSLFTPPFSVR